MVESEGLVQNLKNNGVTIIDEIKEFPYGKFVPILDSEGTQLNFGNLWIIT